MSKPGGDPSSGISSEDVLRPTERHPACRRREARPGFRMERENAGPSCTILCSIAREPCRFASRLLNTKRLNSGR